MSRLIIKNLPAYVTPARLKEHLLQRDGPGGTLTDVKVAQKQDGTSRRFAFVGFKSDEEAAKAQKWFDRTFFDTTRISVAVVKDGAKNAPAPRPNKKPRVDKTTQQHDSLEGTKHRNSEAALDAAKGEKDDALDEFMQVMKPRTKKERTWANDVSEPQRLDVEKEEQADKLQEAEDTPMDEDVVQEVDDIEWMKRRMKRGMKEAEDSKTFTQDEEEDSKMAAPEAPAENCSEHEDTPSAKISQTGRLFLRNLSYQCTSEDLTALFERFGSLIQVHIPLDASSKTSKGIAFVKFDQPQYAVDAFQELDKTSFQGRLLHILPAVDREDSGARVIEVVGKASVKGEKEKKRKQASSKEFNWAMLYMNADAVASSVADRMNVSKADILNPDGDDGDTTSPAVKLALAETHIISETKSFLESEGIDLSAFATLEASDRAVRARRSDTCILVKNIPYGTTAEQIREMFEPHGELAKVVVPPSGTIAVVDFVHGDEAAKAFRAVAYRRLGSSVVYLEKAPIGIFSQGSSNTASNKSSTKSQQPIVIDDKPDNGLSNDVVSGSTLFLKNLAFATTSERLTSTLQHLPGFSFARVQTKPDTKRTVAPGQPAPRLSMGFGFIGFKTVDDAKKALKGLQGFVLDGHALSVKFAGRGAEGDSNGSEGRKESKKSTTTKMIVKNVPFEASKKDLYGLFGSHGQLKSVRLPKKMNSRSRGFAFLDFATRAEAENAYVALKHTHLLGRHLVLEWAEDEGADVDELRKKVGVGFGGGAALPGRKRKLDFGDDDGDGAEL